MHNSQNGTAMSFDGFTHEYLLRGDCVSCHAQDTSANIVNTIPQVYHTATTDLAGGNFRYYSDTHANVHNVSGIMAQDSILGNTPPGYLSDYDPASTDFNTGSRLVCAGQNGCHGNRDQSSEMGAIRGSHHYKDLMLKFGSINEPDQGGGTGGTSDYSTTGKSYRFLYNVHGGENTNWANTNSTNHNEYKGLVLAARTGQSWSNIETISNLCAECHGNFHLSNTGTGIGTASPWLRHPTDAVIPNLYEYAAMTQTGGYNIITPVGRTSIPNSPSANITLNTDVITCLSCHGAHGTSNFKIMRWDYKGWPASGTNGCNVCHTSKI
jgi:cytochrome c553